MDFTLKAIEEMSLTYTEERILIVLSSNDDVTLKFLGENINVLYATLCKEIKKLISKGVVEVNNVDVSLTSFGKTIINYNKFKNKVLIDFCKSNKINKDSYEMFINNKNYNNMKLLLGIKNLLKKSI